MKKQLWLLLFMLILASLLLRGLWRQRTDGEAATQYLSEFEITQCQYIALAHTPGLQLQQQNGYWYITAPWHHPADQNTVNSLLQELAQMPLNKIKRSCETKFQGHTQTRQLVQMPLNKIKRYPKTVFTHPQILSGDERVHLILAGPGWTTHLTAFLRPHSLFTRLCQQPLKNWCSSQLFLFAPFRLHQISWRWGPQHIQLLKKKGPGAYLIGHWYLQNTRQIPVDTTQMQHFIHFLQQLRSDTIISTAPNYLQKYGLQSCANFLRLKALQEQTLLIGSAVPASPYTHYVRLDHSNVVHTLKLHTLQQYWINISRFIK